MAWPDDIARCRANEAEAARRGLEARVEHPFGGGAVVIREWLGAALREVEPLARALRGYERDLKMQEL